MRWYLAVVFGAVWLFQMGLAPAFAIDNWAVEWHEGQSASTLATLVEPAPIDAAVFRLVVPFRTQKDGSRFQTSNCGPATLGMVLDGFGVVGQATDDLRFRSHTYQGTVGLRTGTGLQHIAQVAQDFGVSTVGLYDAPDQFHAWSLDDIRAQLRLARPVMPLVRLYLLPGYEGTGSRWGHYILLTGTAGDDFFYSDALKTDPLAGAGGRIGGAQLAAAMESSQIPGQAVAFGGPGPTPLSAWKP